MPIDRAAMGFLGVDFSGGVYDDILATLDHRACEDRFSFVVTPNVDHVLMLHPKAPTATTAAFRAAYSDAALRLCDSRILQKLARLHGINLDVVTGSDLTRRLFGDGRFDGRKVAIVGGDAMMVPELQRRFPAIAIVQHRPPMGVIHDPAAIDAIVRFVAQEQADYVLFAIGAPQSEIIAHRCLRDPDCRGVGLCIGASIEFLLDRKRRAPLWMQRLSLEWAFRLLSEPRRLWRRYLVTGPRIFLLSLRNRESAS